MKKYKIYLLNVLSNLHPYFGNKLFLLLKESSNLLDSKITNILSKNTSNTLEINNIKWSTKLKNSKELKIIIEFIGYKDKVINIEFHVNVINNNIIRYYVDWSKYNMNSNDLINHEKLNNDVIYLFNEIKTINNNIAYVSIPK